MTLVVMLCLVPFPLRLFLWLLLFFYEAAPMVPLDRYPADPQHNEPWFLGDGLMLDAYCKVQKLVGGEAGRHLVTLSLAACFVTACADMYRLCKS
jgi:hypothetical protein